MISIRDGRVPPLVAWVEFVGSSQGSFQVSRKSTLERIAENTLQVMKKP